MVTLRELLLVSSCTLWLGCGSSSPEGARSSAGAGRAAHTQLSDSGPPALRSARVATVTKGTYGPYVGTGAGRTVLLWAEARAGTARSYFSVALRPDLTPEAAPQRIAEAPAELGLVALEPAGPRSASGAAGDAGYIAVVASPEGEGSALVALLLSERGQARGKPIPLARSASEVLWVDAVATPRGTLALWASKRKGHADVSAVELDAQGTLLGQPVELVRDASAWQAVALPGKLAVAHVQSAANKNDRGTVKLELFAHGTRAERKSVIVNPDASAELDLDMVAIGNQLLLAWSDARELESRVYAALVDAEGKLVRKPAPLVDAFGEQALVQLVPPFAGTETAYVVWETLRARSAPMRSLEVAALDAQGNAGHARGVLSIDAPLGTLPELEASASGLSALTLAPLCRTKQSCADAERVPTFVQFDREFSVAASEPLRLTALRGKGPSLAWGLTCTSGGCFALSALTSSPAPIFTVELAKKSSTFVPAAQKSQLPAPPRARTSTTIAELDPLADITATRIGSTTLCAWVSYFDPSLPWERLKKAAPDGRFEPLRARLETRAFRAEGAPLPSEVLSLRARSVGGVALAAGDPARGEALLAWSAEDNKQPQVFLTLLREDGKRVQQKMLTRRSGEVSDVAVTYTGDGFVVGWIDERDGDPEVYVAKVNRALQRVAPEQRITQARGAATDLRLVSIGDEVLAVWSDARDAEQPGVADLYSIRLRSSNASVVSPEQRLTETRAHSHSPALALRGSSPVVAWIEDAIGQQSTAALKVASLDAQARLAGAPLTVSAKPGNPLSVALSCEADACYAALVVDRGGSAEIRAIPLAQPGKRAVLSELSDAAAQSVPPSLLGSELFFADLSGQQQGHVRRILIEWK
ncbi:MAG TPA: hypothetical protein VK524_06715 [Polyangiaceae bacterium]|nr:hypothetical protein [Polyangiaceae bacterium]